MSTPPVPVFRRKGAGRPSKTEVAQREQRGPGRPLGEAAIMAGYRQQLLQSEKGSQVLNKIFGIAMNDEHPHQAAMLKFLGERLLPASTFEREAGKSNHVKVTVTTADGTTVSVSGDGAPEDGEEADDRTIDAEDLEVKVSEAGGDSGGA